MGDVLGEYRAEMERIFGEDLVSLVLYGSHAADVPDPKGDISLLVVVRKLTREALTACRAVAHRYARRGIPAPPIFTETFLKESADVFPLEFLGLAERRKVLAGTDVVPLLSVSTENLRHQVEFELKGKLLSLRRMYMGAYGNKELFSLVQDTVGSVVSVARGLLLLADREAPHAKAEIVSKIEQRFGVTLPALREGLALRQGGKVSPARAEELFLGYQEEVERLCAIADAYPAAGAP